MKRMCFLTCVLASAVFSTAFGFWPFGDSSKDDEKPKRLSELMEPASLLIDEASDLSSEGKTQEAVAKYRAALVALDAVKNDPKNAARVDKPEFATLRTKRAYVEAAIDSLLLGQSRENAKPVAVSNTAALEKRLAYERREKTLRSHLAKNPKDIRTLNLLAGVLVTLDRVSDAKEILEQALEADEHDWCAHYNLAELIARTEPSERDAARRHYETGRKVGGPKDRELEKLLK